MSNISVYHDSALGGGSTLTATGVGTNSSVEFLADDRLSFKYVTAGGEAEIQVDQPAANVRIFTDLAIVDHNLDGSTFTLTSYTDSGRGSPTVEISAQEIPNEDPFIINIGTLTNYQNFDIDITVSGGGTASVGEWMAATKFTSPVRPAIGIRTDYIPRQTFVILPNGERQAIKHAETIRKKTYIVDGLPIAEAQQWVTVFTTGEGAALVILEDDVGDTYPALMDTQLTINDSTKIVSIELIFEEVKL